MAGTGRRGAARKRGEPGAARRSGKPRAGVCCLFVWWWCFVCEYSVLDSVDFSHSSPLTRKELQRQVADYAQQAAAARADVAGLQGQAKLAVQAHKDVLARCAGEMCHNVCVFCYSCFSIILISKIESVLKSIFYCSELLTRRFGGHCRPKSRGSRGQPAPCRKLGGEGILYKEMCEGILYKEV